MYTNIAKNQAFPLAIKVSPQPKCLKPFFTSKSQYLPIGSHPKPPINPSWMNFSIASHWCGHHTYGDSHFVKAIKFSAASDCTILKPMNLAKPVIVLSRFKVGTGRHSCPLTKARRFSNISAQKVDEKHCSSVVKAENRLPWLASSKVKETKGLEKAKATEPSRSSWEEAAGKLDKMKSKSSWEESTELGETKNSKAGHSYQKVASGPLIGSKKYRNRMIDVVEGNENDEIGREKRFEEENMEVEEEEIEAINDPRWNNIKNRFTRLVDVEDGFEKPEFRRWKKQENWGKKMWKEATESSVPKMVGEGVYGVCPVLAALSAGRREFYVLYVQEGLELANNNRKKKDKKGFEKVLRMAENIGLSIRELSKHDLNMVVDNRPHQGLVLDASPLEMVKIRELDRPSANEDQNSLWLALDEVTDPQNLGAIIRSAYFFGASGVIVCAKNSAPLSGVVSKASAGSVELMELRYCKNMMQFLTSSSENGWRVLGGSVSSKAIPLNEVVPGLPTILVLGSEGTGLRPLVERSCTHLVKIPGNIPVDVGVGGPEITETGENSLGSVEEFKSFLAVESLNVSVAAGVILHHLILNNYKNDSGMVVQ